MSVISNFSFRWLNKCSLSQGIPIITKKQQRYWIFLDDLPPFQITVARYGKPCGLMRIKWQENEIELCEISIFKKNRDKGLGTAFLQWLISYASRNGVKTIWGIVAPDKELNFDQIKNWYLEMGFHLESPKSKIIVFDIPQKNK